jgi:ornithine cyclodeaminase/alanine dehydrogenase-like protein (mu-crystallin family)
MWNDENNKKHMRNVQRETDNPAILNDVISDEEQYPASNQKLAEDSPLSALQEIVRNNTDGKTWQNVDE